MLHIIVYKDRDNSLSLRLKANTLLDPTINIIDLTDITRMVLAREDGFVVDSLQNSTLFDWLTLAAQGIVTIQLGGHNLKVGIDRWRLVVYDSTNPNGLTWGDRGFKIEVKEKYALDS